MLRFSYFFVYKNNVQLALNQIEKRKQVFHLNTNVLKNKVIMINSCDKTKFRKCIVWTNRLFTAADIGFP